MYKLLIVDDEPLVQVGIKSMLNWAELDIEICGIAMNGKAALEIIEQSSPDIVITDIKMPIMDGLELVRICRERWGTANPAFIILTSYEDFHMAKEALTYQVTDYLVKLELTADNLRQAIERVLKQKRERNKEHNNPGSPKLSTGDVQSLYDKFFIRLLHNLFESREQFLLQSRDLGLAFDSPYYVCCYGEMIGHLQEGLPIEKQWNLYSSTLHMLREIIVKYIPAHVISLDLKHFAILFDISADQDLSSVFDSLKEIIGTLNETLHKYYNVNLRVGLGTAVAHTGEIAESYQHARQVFPLTDEAHPYLSIDDCGTGTAPGTFLTFPFLKMLCHRLMKNLTLMYYIAL